MIKEYQEYIKKYEDIKKRAIEGLEKAKKAEGIQEETLDIWRDLIKECDRSIEATKDLEKTWENIK